MPSMGDRTWGGPGAESCLIRGPSDYGRDVEAHVECSGRHRVPELWDRPQGESCHQDLTALVRAKQHVQQTGAARQTDHKGAWPLA